MCSLLGHLCYSVWDLGRTLGVKWFGYCPSAEILPLFSLLAKALFQLFQWKWHMIAFKKFV